MEENKRNRPPEEPLADEALETAAGGFGDMKKRPSQTREYEAEAKEAKG